jgi:hypothetical protein
MFCDGKARVLNPELAPAILFGRRGSVEWHSFAANHPRRRIDRKKTIFDAGKASKN